MANPAPFPPTAYDLPDWTRAVTPVAPSGSGSSAITVASGFAPIIFTQTFSIFGTTTTLTGNIGPNDGKQHSLVSCNTFAMLTSGTISGTVQVACQVVARESPFNIFGMAFFVTNGLPSGGQMPFDRQDTVWPQGAPIPIAPNLTNQLTLDGTCTGYQGGTITGFNFYVQCTLAWS